MAQASVLLFDLGGVLVENSHLEDLSKLRTGALADGELHDLWLSSPAVRAFERGKIDAETFARQFVAEWDVPLAPSDFIRRFAGWPKGFYPGAAALLTRLRPRYKIAYLSNSNPLHWAGFPDILRYADAVFASHICGLVKPDEAIFQLVIAELGRTPGEICFFDDSPRNVQAALATGMDAHLTRGFGELTEMLQALGLD
jgi:putative hydrolase of the HAD superfamily